MFMEIILSTDSLPWANIRWLQIVIGVVLCLMTLYVSLLIITKYYLVRTAARNGKPYAEKITKAFMDNDWEGSMKISLEFKEKSHIAQVVFAGLKVREHAKEESTADQTCRHMTYAMEREVLLVQHKYLVRLGALDAIGATAPFVGALGGTLYSFAWGTALAIPTIWFAAYLRGWALRFDAEAKTAASELTQYVERNIK